MNAEDQLKAAQAEDLERDQPGMGAALLAVLVMIVSTSVLALLIYIVMVTIVPTEPRQVRKPAVLEQPLVQPPATPGASK